MQNKTSPGWGRCLALALTLVSAALGYDIIRHDDGGAVTWNAGTIPIQVKLGSAGTQLDGLTFNQSALAAMTLWNAQMSAVQFSGSSSTTGVPLEGNNVNEIGFDSKVYGTDDFDDNVLAVTMTYYYASPTRGDGTHQVTQSDIVVNSAPTSGRTWSSFRGALSAHPSNLDIQRVVLHELGHMLGLNHPDQATPAQSVSAIMNAFISDLDSLTSDGIAGIQSLYFAPGSVTAPTINTHPANKTATVGTNVQFSVSATGSGQLYYQWQRMAVGSGTWTNLSNNGNFSGVTASTLTIYGVTSSMNGDQFRCQVTNGGGPTTSNAATLTVTIVAPSISYHPSPQTVYAGNSATFSVGVNGTSPFTYQWRKNTVPIANATSAVFMVNSAQASDAGNYSVVVSNSAGSVTSNDAALVVNPSVAPSITGLPATVTVEYYGSFSFFPNVNGTPPLTYSWAKDGVPIPGANSNYYYRSNLTPADAGVYTFTATNPVGTVSSSSTVTVSAAVAPSITQQPVSANVVKGYSVTLYVTAGGSNPLSYQWYLNGQAIAGAVGYNYYISNATAANAGVYTVKVTNTAGSIWSSPAEVVVLPAAPPQISALSATASIGPNSNYLSFYTSVTGTAPIALQWYKDGVAIPGANSSSYYKYAATAADAGTYVLQATNEAGLAVSNECVVTWTPQTSGVTWLDSGRVGNVVYLVATSPGRVMRYDLAAESWLPVVYLNETKVPTAFLPTPEGIFMAYGRDVVRRSLDLQTEDAVGTAATNVQMLFSVGARIYARDSSIFHSWNRSTLAAGLDSSPGYYSLTTRPIYSNAAHTLFSTRYGITPNDIEKFNVSADGVISANGDSPYHGYFRIGSRQYLTPDETRLFDNSGVIYTTGTLDYTASLGTPFDDIVFLASGSPVVLRGQTLMAHGGAGYAETGRYAMNATGYALFVLNDKLFVFGAADSNQANPGVTKVTAAAFTTPPLATPGSPVQKLFSVEDSFIDNQSVVHLFSRSEKGIVRWDAKTGAFLATLPLRGSPMFSSYAPALDRLALVYRDGALTDFLPGSDTTEAVFGYIPTQNAPFALVAMDDLTFLNFYESDVSADMRIVVDMLGNLKSLSNSSYWGAGLAWQSSGRRLYSRANYYDNIVQWEQIPVSGVLPNPGIAGSANNVVPPLRFRNDGALVLTGNQRILNADLQQTGTLANSVADGTWLSDGLYTIRVRPDGTELQQWAPITFALTGSLMLPGSPLRVFRVSNTRLAVITMVNGYAAFHLVDNNRVLVSSLINSPIPFITQQPVSQIGIIGTSVTLTVGATGNPAPTYQWRKNGVNIPGATGASYTIANVQAADGGSYTVVATNSAGSATSNAAVLTVVAPAAHADLDGDRKPDLIWQNRITGERSFWLMNGTAFGTGFAFWTVDPAWQIDGTGDFDGNGGNDLIWTNTLTGERSIWFMNGTALGYGVSLGTVPLDWQIAAIGEFNGDGKSDLVWQNVRTGERSIWLMNGGAFTGVAMSTVPPEWQIVSSGDFNADGKSDLVWTNATTGERAIWLMNGTAFGSGVSLGTVAKIWQIVGSGDFNADGKSDLVWTHTGTGERTIWLMNGTAHTSTITVGTVTLDWVLGHTQAVPAPVQSDFTGDANSDIIWQNLATGERSLWVMNGTAMSSGVNLATIPTDWQIVASGDFNADGKSDIVWANTTTGECSFWLMNGTTFNYGIGLGAIPTQWQIAASGDYNGDGKSDLVWSNTITGERSIWLMNGTTYMTGAALTTVPTNWQIVASGDFNADGKSDLVWTDTTTGERSIWFMDGTAFSWGVSLGVVPLNLEIVGTGDFNGDGKSDLVWTDTATGQRTIWLMNGTTHSSTVSLGFIPTQWSIRN